MHSMYQIWKQCNNEIVQMKSWGCMLPALPD
nr:MAG TPA: hypothetical protein [Caudoviricetes sp.]